MSRGAVLAPVRILADQPLDGGGVHGRGALLHRLFEPVDRGDPAVLDDDLARVGQDLQPISTHHVVRTGDEDAARP